MEIDRTIIDMEDNVYNSNLCKEVVLRQLLLDGVITDKQYDEYTVEWNIVIVKKSWFKKFFKCDDNNIYVYKYVKF